MRDQRRRSDAITHFLLAPISLDLNLLSNELAFKLAELLQQTVKITPKKRSLCYEKV